MTINTLDLLDFITVATITKQISYSRWKTACCFIKKDTRYINTTVNLLDMESQCKGTRKGSLHSSIVEGSKPDGGRHEMHRDQHFSILFEGLLKSLDKTYGLVLQGVHLCRFMPSFPFLLLWLMCGTGLRLLLRRRRFWQMCIFTEGWGWQPALACGWRQGQAEGTATKCCCWWWFQDVDAHQQWTCGCQPLQPCPVI